MSILATLRVHTDTLETETLLQGIALLDRDGTTEDERLVRAAMYETLEARYPSTTRIMDRWSEDLETTLSYAQALTAAVRAAITAAYRGGGPSP